MTKDKMDLPDMGIPDMGDMGDYVARQMEAAMAEVQKAMTDLPDLAGFDTAMGSFASLLGNLPGQLGELSGAMAGFGEQHEANVASMVGEPDWALDADIRVGDDKLHVVIHAVFDLAQIQQAWQSTQGAGFESLVRGVAGGTVADMESGVMDQVLGQLKKGRSIAQVEDIDVVACHIQGAPGNAMETLQLSPEGHIPLVLAEDGLGFEFAPVLTIRNRWEHANIPTFVPMGEAVVVPLEKFAAEQAFALTFEPGGQDDAVRITLNFKVLN